MTNTPNLSSTENSSQQQADKRLIERLKACQKLTLEHAESRFGFFFRALDEHLMQKQQDAETNADERYFSDTLRSYRNHVSEFQRYFLGYLGEGFVKFKQGTLNTQGVVREDDQKLSLVEHHELEQSLASTSVATRVSGDNVELLWALNKRFSVLNGGAKIKDATNPISPIQYCESLRKALQATTVDVRGRLLAFNIFETAFLNDLEVPLVAVNEYLIQHGILPNLSVQSSSEDAGQSAAGDNASPQDWGDEENHSSQLEAAQEAVAEAISSAEHQAQLMRAIRDIQTRGAMNVSNSSEAKPTPVAEMRQGSSQAPPVAGSVAPGPITVFSNHQLVGALQSMQAQILDIRETVADQLSPLNTAQVTEKLSQQLEKEAKNGAVDPNDMHTIELVGMLFDYMLSDEHLPDNVKALLSYLHTPYLKIAFTDPGFFEQSEHPARLLLNNMAEAGVRWVSNDGSSQYDIYDKIKNTVSTILEEFDDDVRLLAELLLDFSSYTKKILRRQELMEKRAMEKVQGEEKLREVKVRVNDEVRSRTDGQELPSAVLLLLLQPWSDYMAFVLLRYGDDSDSWNKALSAVEEVIWSVKPKQSAEDRAKQLELQDPLLDQLEAGMENIGYDQGKSKKLIETLSSLQRSALMSKNMEVAPQPMRDKLETMAAEKAGQQAVVTEQLSDEEARLVESLKMIEFGTWFEFEGGRRLKVAWYNSKTLHYMLVDQMGKKVAMKSGVELARDMLNHRAKVIAGSTKPFFERALENIFHSLNQHSNDKTNSAVVGA
ncbi:DUF1631 family protein [Marinibactrum halimedae]|uniref:DUF1631 domain-containing protein n=1 Tax=Marinibactrum halimedae TaxID=1444977 RepID=A0AA37TAG5_9GAMM|nr:DUF1631 family protein [Marinibactrum halimedae]MCD9460509.1 DUF1631 domain-containing protein [Marinibactrum halimedae]GLS27872.1 hypothetical protein GCM10007877_35910 [Marinibactrum halimedae]